MMECIPYLVQAGITPGDAQALRRIAMTLHLLLQDAKSLIDIVVANENLQWSFLPLSSRVSARVPLSGHRRHLRNVKKAEREVRAVLIQTYALAAASRGLSPSHTAVNRSSCPAIARPALVIGGIEAYVYASTLARQLGRFAFVSDGRARFRLFQIDEPGRWRTMFSCAAAHVHTRDERTFHDFGHHKVL